MMRRGNHEGFDLIGNMDLEHPASSVCVQGFVVMVYVDDNDGIVALSCSRTALQR